MPVSFQQHRGAVGTFNNWKGIQRTNYCTFWKSSFFSCYSNDFLLPNNTIFCFLLIILFIALKSNKSKIPRKFYFTYIFFIVFSHAGCHGFIIFKYYLVVTSKLTLDPDLILKITFLYVTGT